MLGYGIGSENVRSIYKVMCGDTRDSNIRSLVHINIPRPILSMYLIKKY